MYTLSKEDHLNQETPALIFDQPKHLLKYNEISYNYIMLCYVLEKSKKSSKIVIFLSNNLGIPRL